MKKRKIWMELITTEPVSCSRGVNCEKTIKRGVNLFSFAYLRKILNVSGGQVDLSKQSL